MSRINSTIQGPQNVPDGRIDGRGLTFNAPLAAIGQSFESLGALGNQMANHYKKIHDTNVAKKAAVEFDLRVQEAGLALDAAPDPDTFSSVLAAESAALTSLANEMVDRVDGPQLREQMMAQMNLRSGKFSIEARGMLFKKEEAEYRLGLSNDVDQMREAGDFDGAISAIEERGPLTYSGEQVRGLVSRVEHERDLADASFAVEDFRSGSGSAPDVDSYENLTFQDRLQLRRRISAVQGQRSGVGTSASLSDAVDDLVGRGVPFQEGMADIRERLSSGGLEGDALEDAVSSIEDDYMVVEIGHALSLARRDGTLTAYNQAISFMQDARFESSPDALDAAARASEYLRNGVDSLSLGDHSDRGFVREASLRVGPAVDALLSQVEYSPDGRWTGPGDEAVREAISSAIGLDGLEMPSISADGELISEGDISVAAMHGAEELIQAGLDHYRKAVEDAAPPTLFELSQSPASNTSPVARTQMLDQHWGSVGVDVSAQGQEPEHRMLNLTIDAMNTQQALPSSIASGLMGGLSGLEANANFHENMAMLRREGLEANAFASFRDQNASSESAYQDFIALNDAYSRFSETAETPSEALKQARQSIETQGDLDPAQEFLDNHKPGVSPAFDQSVLHFGLDLVDEEGGELSTKEFLSQVATHFLESSGVGEEPSEASQVAARAMAGAWSDALREASSGLPLRPLTGDEMEGLLRIADEAVNELGYAPTRFASAGDSVELALHAPEAMYATTGRDGGLTAFDSVLLPLVSRDKSSHRPLVESSYVGEEGVRSLISSVGIDASVVIGPQLGGDAEHSFRRLHEFWTSSPEDLSPDNRLVRSAITDLNRFHARVSSGDPVARLSDTLGAYDRNELVRVYNQLGDLIGDVIDVSDRLVLDPQKEPADDTGRTQVSQIAEADARGLPRSLHTSTVQYEARFIGPDGNRLVYEASGIQPYYERSLVHYRDLVARRLHVLAGETPGGRLASGVGEAAGVLAGGEAIDNPDGLHGFIRGMSPDRSEFSLEPPPR